MAEASRGRVRGLLGRSAWEAEQLAPAASGFSAALPVAPQQEEGQDVTYCTSKQPLRLEILACPSIWLVLPDLLGELPLVRCCREYHDAMVSFKNWLRWVS